MIDYLDRVQKLLNQAEDLSVTPAEAKAFLDKAMEIMAAQGIEKAMLGETVSDVMMDKIREFDAPYASNKSDLYVAIAKSFRCKALILQGKRRHIFGYRSDIERTEELFTLLLLHGQTVLMNTRVPAGTHLKSFTSGWWNGYVSEIRDRLENANKKATDNTPGSAVVLFDREKAADAAMRAAYSNIRQVAQYRGGASSGWSNGRAAGAKANLTLSGKVGNTTRRAIS